MFNNLHKASIYNVRKFKIIYSSHITVNNKYNELIGFISCTKYIIQFVIEIIALNIFVIEEYILN